MTGWLASLVLGITLGVVLAAIDGVRSGLVVGLAVTTTALGTLLPILRDSGELRTSFGTQVLAGAAVGELGQSSLSRWCCRATSRPAPWSCSWRSSRSR